MGNTSGKHVRGLAGLLSFSKAILKNMIDLQNFHFHPDGDGTCLRKMFGYAKYAALFSVRPETRIFVRDQGLRKILPQAYS